jgi:microcystin-dependent protein
VAFIHVDSSSKITRLDAGFDYLTYAIPVDSAYLVCFSSDLSVYAGDAVQAKHVEGFLSRLSVVDIRLYVFMGGFSADGFSSEGVSGSGLIQLIGLSAAYDKPISLSNFYLFLLLGSTVVDNSAAGSVPLTLTRCRSFILGEIDITVKAAATGLSLEINASNGSIATILMNAASTEFLQTKLVAIKDNSSVDISETDSSACNVSFTPVTVSRSKVVHNLSTPYAGTDLSIAVTLGGQLFYRNISLAYALAMEGSVVVY